ncbi:DNA-formamidopyrimidine glycosylase family protein [Pedobacter immunditicola]|uniref:DNA-formamidopyrimidine glycosylase family protein n=1 Tax=Pedobacter immunditicola TaxID=3133440 RepID=UPI00309A0563
MPELPDLQLFSSNLHQKLAGNKLIEIKVLVSKNLNVTETTLQKTLLGQQLQAVKRVGKELHFKFEKEDVLALHLMLHGELHYFEDSDLPKFAILVMGFSNGKGLALSDFQKMATPTLNPAPSAALDAMSDEINADFLKKLLHDSKASIKNILLDQKLIRGIGNAYADEILWDARISPFSAANQIPADKVNTLVKSIKSVLLDAEKQLKLAHPDIISGEYREFLKVHGPKIKQSPTGAEVLIKKTGSRKTYYTSEQELFI